MRTVSAAPCNAPTSPALAYKKQIQQIGNYNYTLSTCTEIVRTCSVMYPRIIGMAEEPAARNGIPRKICSGDLA